LLHSWTITVAAGSFHFLRPTCLRQTPSFQDFLSQKLKPDVWKVVFNNTLKSKVFNTWTNASQKGVEPRN
jgi:hypothetical protein